MIPFNKPYMTGNEIENISQAYLKKQLAGDGYFTNKCEYWLDRLTGTKKSLLTNSCTSALEIASILANIQKGDEIILPSFTFVSTANSFVIRGGKPVFVDIRKDTLNIDESLIEPAITDKTKAIIVVHYAGVACEMEKINSIAKKHNLLVIEDSAHGVCCYYKGLPLGSLGDFGCYSFHETKNLISGHGGALLINNSQYIDRAEIIRERGTNRKEFSEGKVDKYSWNDIGSSYMQGELVAAFLWAQLEAAKSINSKRIAIWNIYKEGFKGLEKKGVLRTPYVPTYCKHSGHIFYLILKDQKMRNSFISKMKEQSISCLFHYIPLHESSYAKKLNLDHNELPITKSISNRIVRLPLWLGIEDKLDYIITKAHEFIK
ncbi:dTDP-4-amino-4,6-dideoxygalactose transaminase [Prochlorococcus marinus]|uniref:dTDP-4-amino-4,6-dideoxygalactose transaminase n=1 Tax=Prochlorococcus marinus TaxID=1219 RepID=UPI0022B5D76A|nr:dTDP-4-amino-4,6-dideoxygalactose transaminase [Prochlorococcus marinus]